MGEWAGRLRLWWQEREHNQLLCVLICGLLVNLATAPFHGFFGDLQAYVTWGGIFDRDPLHFYSAAVRAAALPSNPPAYPPNYPPLTIYLFGLLDAMYLLVAHLVDPHATLVVAHAPLLAVVVKLPIILAALAASAIIYRVARSVRSQRWALIATAIYALSPVVLFDGALWGQTDALAALAVVAALLLALDRHPAWSGVLCGLAIMLKPQPIIFAPLVLVYLWRWKGAKPALRYLAGLAGAVVGCCLPLLLPPQPEILVFAHVTTGVIRSTPFASIDAFNLWWLLLIPGHIHTAPWIGPFTPYIVGLALFMGVALLVAAGIWRDASPEHLFLGAGILAVAFFDVTTLQRERYLYPAVALFLIAAIWNARHLLYYAVATLTCFLNMGISIIIHADPRVYAHPSDPGIPLEAWRGFVISHGALTVAIAAINVWLLLTAVTLYARAGLTTGWRRNTRRSSQPITARTPSSTDVLATRCTSTPSVNRSTFQTGWKRIE
jgi:Gpi18-like mannosyltransferase